MKKIIAAIAVVTMGLSASSCADFLDVQPEGNPNQGGYFQTDKEAEDAIGAVYWICSGSRAAATTWSATSRAGLR